jgi:multiple sugar transport system ATP-binding protein
MTVHGNLAFPLRMQGLSTADIEQRVLQIADMLDLTALLERRPKALSGGQRQRVAMGRAIIREANLFLMDEPLSNLDARLRVQIRSEIIRLQRELAITTIYVTHDQAEAMTLGQRIAVLKEGCLQQVGEPREIYEFPANTFVAGFIGSPGMNLIRGSLHQGQDMTLLQLGPLRLALPDRVLARYPDICSRYGQTLLIGIRPSEVFINSKPSQNNLPAQVCSVESLGHETILHLTSELDITSIDPIDRDTAANQPQPLLALLPGHHSFNSGETLNIRLETDNLYLFNLHGTALQRR